jgi:hypothetical protein
VTRVWADIVKFLAVIAGVLAVLAAASGAQAERRVAVVIGNSEYEHAPKLRNPRNDAEALVAKLEGTGFEVMEGFDLDHSGMVDTFKEFGSKLADADVALFFYAGHGVQVDGQNYLVPVDAQVRHEDEIAFELIGLNTVMRQMERGGDRIKLAFLDACRDNPFKDALAPGGTRGAVSLGKGLGEMRAPRGTFIAFATEPDQVALDGDGGNSPFTTALIQHMGVPGASIQDMMIKVRRDVSAATDGKQTPWDSSSLMESFTFVPTAASSAGEPAPTAAPVAGGSAAREDFDLAMSIGSCEAVSAFLEVHPDAGMLTALARKRKDELCAAAVTAEAPPAEEPQQLAMAMRAVRPAGTCTRGPEDVTYCATSVLAPIKANRYDPAMLFDGKGETAWVEADAADGVGETLTLDFGGERLLAGFEISNGYDKDERTWTNNSRVSSFELTLADGSKLAADLPDQRGVNVFEFGRPVRTSSMALTILEVFPGAKYRDTAISELRPVFAD